jgi:hypothetical protein
MPKQVTNVAADDALTTIYRLSHDEVDQVSASASGPPRSPGC